MPRPRSDKKRNAILEAATRVIVTEGLSAPTMGIAKEAGGANGSLFTYFETKAVRSAARRGINRVLLFRPAI